MSDESVKLIAEVLRRTGWTCEYHEPVSARGECTTCDASHDELAAEIDKALGGLVPILNQPGRWLTPYRAERDE